eukprot:6198215-Pleurochrysis_carterae.AAC.1
MFLFHVNELCSHSVRQMRTPCSEPHASSFEREVGVACLCTQLTDNARQVGRTSRDSGTSWSATSEVMFALSRRGTFTSRSSYMIFLPALRCLVHSIACASSADDQKTGCTPTSMPCKAVLRAQEGTEVTVTARITGQAILKCPEPVTGTSCNQS